MRRFITASAIALAAIALSIPAPAQAQSQADGVRNAGQHQATEFSDQRRRWSRRHWRHRHWGGFPLWPLAFAAAAAAPYAYYGPPRYYYPRRYYYRPAYYPYYPRYRYWRRPGISVSFGFGGYPYWW